MIEDILRNLTWNKEKDSMQVVAHCMVGNNLWAVCEHTKKAIGDQPAVVYRFIALYLLRRYGKDEWAYKDMDESCGPCESNCPLAYLDLAPDTGHLGGYSADWRGRVRAFWKAKQDGRAFAKTLKPGDKFQWGHFRGAGMTAYYITFERIVGNSVIGNSDRGRFRYPMASIGPAPAYVQPEIFKKEVQAGAILVPAL
jgi:hypothetical protein